MNSDPVLECQDCGRVLRHLSTGEAQQVADNPHNLIAYCSSCAEFRHEILVEQITELMLQPIEDDDH